MKVNRTILIRNIYCMLAYAFSDLRFEKEEPLAKEEFDNIHSLFAAMLASGVGRQLKQGLYREYRDRRETLSTVRGRLQMRETMLQRMARRPGLVCEYDELSENCLFNRILKTTMWLLLRHPGVKEEYRAALRRCYFRFSAVDFADPASIPWRTLRFQKSNQSYRLLLGVCQLVLEGMLLTTEQGEYQLASFVDEQQMHRLYEKFLLEYYRKEWGSRVRANPAQVSWALDDDVRDLLPAMRTDVTLEQGNRVLILDAKFYRSSTRGSDRRTLHSANLYQMFAYVKNRDAGFGTRPHQVSGLLLYARTVDPVQPDVTYRMSGNRIGARTLDLNLPFQEIAACLDAIVEEFFPPR